MKIRCLIIDDETLAHDVIESYIKEFPLIELVRKCNNAIEALEALQQEGNIQLLFLDIKMPGLSGINLLKSLPKAPDIIFTTAYPQHAVEGFELNAVDYLLKPFSFERFLLAVNKVRHKIELESRSAAAQGYFTVKADKRIHKLNFEDVTYMNSIGDYLKIFLKNGKVIITGETLKSIEESLPSNLFLRIHKSYIVAVSSILYIEGNQLVIAGASLPIGLKYKDQVIDRFA
ncbi:LytR/AlgR family response regulator transcription factor [Chitinophaga silvisoli]|uniref:DNA-binding response regulator n=1 Tax=Chitinophaga silvisoli TaxID=2291814 RepID=A0A3E1NZP3_9BACT|nr:LytTR family DNA-binding domain-containing protein [Chitinophaga silvisoli]RFM33411.1 DNA-binding response regulator [Chitinophaga silvisoli]